MSDFQTEIISMIDDMDSAVDDWRAKARACDRDGLVQAAVVLRQCARVLNRLSVGEENIFDDVETASVVSLQMHHGTAWGHN